jgi:hypothetical protein
MKLLHTLSYWTPRILGLLIAFYVSLFAFNTPEGMPVVSMDLLLNLLPSIVLLVTAIASWKREVIGIVTYTLLGLGYAIFMAKGHPDWILAISGPLFLCAILFAISRRMNKRLM